MSELFFWLLRPPWTLAQGSFANTKRRILHFNPDLVKEFEDLEELHVSR